MRKSVRKSWHHGSEMGWLCGEMKEEINQMPALPLRTWGGGGGSGRRREAREYETPATGKSTKMAAGPLSPFLNSFQLIKPGGVRQREPDRK